MSSYSVDAGESIAIGLTDLAAENAAVLSFGANWSDANTICQPHPVHLGVSRPHRSRYYHAQFHELRANSQRLVTDLFNRVEAEAGEPYTSIGSYSMASRKTDALTLL